MAIFKEPSKKDLTPAVAAALENPEVQRFWGQRCACGSQRTWHGPSGDKDGAGPCERRYCPCRQDGQNTCTAFRPTTATPLTVARMVQ
jgi:hypothetical protein